MRKSILKIGALALFGMATFASVSNAASVCREVKLSCKDEAKLDEVYTPLERSICRDLKLECKS